MMLTLKAALVPPTWTERLFWGFVGCLILTVVWQAFDRAHPSEIVERTC